MPTYLCYLPRDRFSQDQKAQIASAISFRHSEATGAPSYFVQVVIEETRAERYLGGKHTSDHVWIRGDIRAGRTEQQRTSLMLNVMQEGFQTKPSRLLTGAERGRIRPYLWAPGCTDRPRRFLGQRR